MKRTIFILTYFFITLSCEGQEKVSFQDYLSDYIIEKQYLKNGYPNLEYSANGISNIIFWYKMKGRFYLIFCRNNEIFFIEDYASFPVGEKDENEVLGQITLFPKKDYRMLKSLEFINLTSNVMNNYSVSNEFRDKERDKIGEYYNPYTKEVKIDSTSTSLPIEIQGGIPILYLKVDDGMIAAALEY